MGNAIQHLVLCDGTPSGSSVNYLTPTKQLSILLVLAAVLYHGNHHSRKEYTCDNLLADGSFVSGDIWQPRGCLMRNYTPGDTSLCLRALAAGPGNVTKLVFVGDSRVRALYNGVLEQLNTKFRVKKGDPPDTVYNVEELRLETMFLWRPLMAEKLALELVGKFKLDPPSLVVVGGILHSLIAAKDHSKGLLTFRKGLTAFAQGLAALPAPPRVLFMLSEPFNLNSTKTDPRRRNGRLQDYNSVAIEVLESSAVTLWRSVRLIGTLRNWDYTDGIHAGMRTVTYYVQILLNYLCNRHLAGLQPELCCGPLPLLDAPVVGVLAAMGCSLGLLGLLLHLILKHTGARADKGRTLCVEENQLKGKVPLVVSSQSSPLPQLLNGLHQPHGESPCDRTCGSRLLELIWALFKLTLILGYFTLCERVNLFPKAMKNYSFASFVVPIAAALLVAVVFGQPLLKSASFGTLQRDVTDEWKGWMQLVLLVYHATGASQNLLIYMNVRVLVASYLFLTGYGHFTRFWKTGGTGGFRRYCQSMFRLNFLTILLCLVMDQPYMNYYFTVLVSFWFTVIHVVLALPPGINSGPDRALVDYGVGTLKIALLAATVAVLALSEEAFLSVFSSWPLAVLFRLGPDGGLHEWRFRWMLDRWSPLYGMVFALVAQALGQFTSDRSFDPVWLRSKLISLAIGLTALVVGLSSYAVLVRRCGGKVECNAWHPYIAWIPILSFIHFRHQLTLVRAYFSPLFAWLGVISLELFVCQYHILLSHNTHGLLVLVPGLPLVNVLVTGTVLVSSAHELHRITELLQKALLG